MTSASVTAVELSVPEASISKTALAAAAFAAVITPTIGAVVDPVPPRVMGTIPAVSSWSPELLLVSFNVK